ncbi:hypothetical protein LBMAG39_04050 [Cyanobium sp.]|nr:hypothetical protein LBMAG39_04050 [Cyanobium sp.]
MRLQPLQVAHIVTDEIGARRPGRQAQAQAFLSGRDGEADPHQVALGVATIELNLNHPVLRP